MKDSSEAHVKDGTGSTLQRECTVQQKEGSNEEMVTEAKSVLLPIPPAAPCDALLGGGRALSETRLQLGRFGASTRWSFLAPSSGSILLQMPLR